MLDWFMSLTIPRLKNAWLQILCDDIMLKWYYVVLGNVLITLMCYRNLQVNHCDPKSDLNSCFRMELPLYDLEMAIAQLSYL